MDIICFLTVRPTKLFYNFIKQIKSHKIFICIDDNTYNIPDYDNCIEIIKINNDECNKAGFKGSVMYFKDSACSRDKALYYFSKIYTDFNKIWFIEEDVFIPTIDTIINIDNKYKEGDLLCKTNKLMNEKTNDWYHWKSIYNKINISLPYARSLICAIRCSKKMVQCIEQYADKYKTLFIDEAFFNTLVYHNNLKVVCPIELCSIKYRCNWKINDINPNFLYHPIKDINIHYKFRNQKMNENIIPKCVKNNNENKLIMMIKLKKCKSNNYLYKN
jgi:hypothetical protein